MHVIYLVVIAWTLWKSVDLIYSHARTHARTQFFSESEGWL